MNSICSIHAEWHVIHLHPLWKQKSLFAQVYTLAVACLYFLFTLGPTCHISQRYVHCSLCCPTRFSGTWRCTVTKDSAILGVFLPTWTVTKRFIRCSASWETPKFVNYHTWRAISEKSIRFSFHMSQTHLSQKWEKKKMLAGLITSHRWLHDEYISLKLQRAPLWA